MPLRTVDLVYPPVTSARTGDALYLPGQVLAYNG